MSELERAYREAEERDAIDEAAQRNDMARVIVIALLSQGYIAGTDAPSIGLAFLRELEEQGYTLRLMTDAELREHRRFGPAA